jgi:hypothetical protein
VTASAVAPDQQLALQRSLISEVFHNLSQPLTALHCSLDLALRRDRTVEELQGSIQAALEDAERLRQRLLLVRSLSDATDPGDLSRPTDLAELFRELQQDMLPLFESAGKRLEVQIEGEPIPVRGNKLRLIRSLFCFLEYLYGYSQAGALLSIHIARGHRQCAEIKIAAPGSLPLGPDDDPKAGPYSCEIEMIRRTFKAAGGDFSLVSAAADHSSWWATLPLFR